MMWWTLFIYYTVLLLKYWLLQSNYTKKSSKILIISSSWRKSNSCFNVDITKCLLLYGKCFAKLNDVLWKLHSFQGIYTFDMLNFQNRMCIYVVEGKCLQWGKTVCWNSDFVTVWKEKWIYQFFDIFLEFFS